MASLTMWPFGKRTAREKEIRRSKAERRLPWYQRLYERVHPQPFVLLLFCAVTVAVIVNAGHDVLGLRVGQRVPRPITSRITFRLEDQARTQVMRMRARDNAEDYYALETSLLQDIRGRLARALPLARQNADNPDKLRADAAEIKVLLDDDGLAEMLRLGKQPDATVYERSVERALQTLQREPLVKADEQAPRRTGIFAILVDPEQSTERKVSINELLFANKQEDVAGVAAAAANKFPEPLRLSMNNSLLAMLQGDEEGRHKALYIYDPPASRKAAREAEDRVPIQYKEYPVRHTLADAGLIDDQELAILKEEHERYRRVLSRLGRPLLHNLPIADQPDSCSVTLFEDGDPVAVFEDLRESQASPDRNVLAIFEKVQELESFQAARRLARWEPWARGLVAFLVVFGLSGYIILIHEKLLLGTRQRFAIVLTLLIVLVLARAIYLHTSQVYLVMGLYTFAIALLAITSGRGPTYAVGGLLALMVALATREGIGFVFILVAVALILFAGLRDLRNRGRIIAVGAVAALVVLGTTLLVGTIEGQTLTFILWNRALWATLTVLAAAFIVEGILPGIERLFGITTNLTLLEWCDPNKPLMRMLAAESPGTYNHSLLVSTLADAAAVAIGANGLLARAGAYYHDIGKINKPEYFVENQGLGMVNRHERLSPAMSHLIIIGHVKDGVEMARAYGVPASLRAFIPEHHGTCVVEYFYHAASKARKPGDPEVSDTQFRYPGPKPQARESAIVMMCDAVEGAVRAMPEPTPNRIEDTVNRIVQKRLADGQFDECDLTFRELAVIRSSLVKSLNSIYHGRIKYPSDEEEAEVRSAS